MSGNESGMHPIVAKKFAELVRWIETANWENGARDKANIFRQLESVLGEHAVFAEAEAVAVEKANENSSGINI